jgi:hypothetical protein
MRGRSQHTGAPQHTSDLQHTGALQHIAAEQQHDVRGCQKPYPSAWAFASCIMH